MQEGQTYFQSGLILAARQAMEQRLSQSRRGDHSYLCSALNGLGSVLLELNMLSEAEACFLESVQISSESSVEDVVRSWCNLSLCQYLSGSVEESKASAKKAYDQAQVLHSSNPRFYLHAKVILGLAYIADAQWENARPLHEEALALAEQLRDEFTRARLLNNLGLIHVEQGEFTEGEQYLASAHELMTRIGNASALAYTTTELGRLHLKRGDLAKALHYGSLALRILWANMSGLHKAEVARLCELFGTVAHATGDRQGAIGYLQRAATYYGQQDRWTEWEKVSATLTEVLRSSGQPAVTSRIAIDRADKELLRYFTALLGLMDTYESLYPHLRGRSELVAKYSSILGSAVGVEQKSLENLTHAARLHDVGLTSMEAPSPNDGAGQGRTHEHSLIGERVLHMLELPKEIRVAVRHHREWYDGTGGPDGMQGEEIPLFSRIISVVSGYISYVLRADDHQTSHSKALEYVSSRAGTEYDPTIVKKFIDLHNV